MTKFSPQTYAALMAQAKVDVSELYTSNCLGICFFPTETGHMHKGLGGKDIVGPTLSQLPKYGI